jgi:hypothetical protein
MNYFVFGSNLSGHHGKGAALFARQTRGAIQGVGSGPQGSAWGIPTKGFRDEGLREKYSILPLTEIKHHVDDLLVDARQYPTNTYTVTRIGCGLAGYKNSDMAPLFHGAPSNCSFDPEWIPWGLKAWASKP